MNKQNPLPLLRDAGAISSATKARMRLAHQVLERLAANPDVKASWVEPVDYPEFRAPEALHFDDGYIAQAYQPGLGENGPLLIVTETRTGVVDVWFAHLIGRVRAVDSIERIWDTGRSDPYVKDEILDGLVDESQLDDVWRAITGKGARDDW